MGVTDATVAFTEDSLANVQHQLRAAGLDGWLLYDFHGANPIAAGVLGLPPLTRRFFVFLPAHGRPVALTHRIEQQPWRGWIGENRPYLSWRSLEEGLRSLLRDRGAVAMEYSAGGAIPYLDRVPAGLLELLRETGVRVVSSGDLVSAFYSRWSASDEASHLRAARALRDVAHDAFDRLGRSLRSGETPTEWELREWIRSELTARGLNVGVDAIVAVNANAANPHYAPGPEDHASIGREDLVLIDLWGKESTDSVYADQTWMAFTGAEVPARIVTLWNSIRDARDAAVSFIETRFAAGEAVAGCQVDDVARGVLEAHGHGGAFIHRTGHSIDRELHGSGPNIDNLETRDERLLIPGIGFSIEPGVYYPEEVGLRTEIDVFMGENGPIVTTPEPQREVYLIT